MSEWGRYWDNDGGEGTRKIMGIGSGESKPERTGTPFWGPKKPKKAFRGRKISEFSPERLIQVRSGAQCTKHFPTPYTYPLPVINDWNQDRAPKVY